jgi:hypothetical protein
VQGTLNTLPIFGFLKPQLGFTSWTQNLQQGARRFWRCRGRRTRRIIRGLRYLCHGCKYVSKTVAVSDLARPSLHCSSLYQSVGVARPWPRWMSLIWVLSIIASALHHSWHHNPIPLFQQCLVYVLVFFLKFYILCFNVFSVFIIIFYNKNKVFLFHFCIFIYLDASLKFGERKHTSFFFK